MIKTPLSTVIGGAGIWTPGCTVIGSASKTLNQLIKSLFANSEVGFAYDPNDLTTMFQDAEGTVPVTGAGQPVGLIKDKSGRGNHARQTVSASRPVLQRNATTGAYYLAFDGADDFLVTNSINFTSTDKVSLFVGIKSVLTLETYQVVMELSASVATNNGAFVLTSPHGGNGIISYTSKGNVRSDNIISAIQVAERVISAQSVISSDTNKVKVNNVLQISSTDQGTGNYGNYPLYIGRRAGTSLPFSGHLHSLIGIGRLTTDAETIALEKSIAKNTGVTLSV